MRSLHLALALAAFGFFCGQAPKQPKRHSHASAGAEQKYCNDRPINPFGKVLPIEQVMQECSEHCWAAVLEMVGQYYGRETHICELAGIVKGERNACCLSDNICGDPSCNRAVPENQISEILLKEMGLQSSFFHRILMEEELQIELSNGRPVIVGYAGRKRSHVALIVGFSFEPDIVFGVKAVYYLADPYVGSIQMDYEQIFDGVGIDEPMPWVESWWLISGRKDGCNEQFDTDCTCEPSG